MCDRIMTGVYPAGTKLPPIRKLADDLAISRNTVEAAYQQLTQEGYVSSRIGSGFVVETLDLSSKDAENHPETASRNFLERLAATGLWESGAAERMNRLLDGNDSDYRRHELTAETNRPLAGDDVLPKDALPPIRFDFTFGNLPTGTFPSQLWRKLTAEVLSGTEAFKASSYTDKLGERSLREQIALRLQVASGVNCHPAQIVIQAGTQASLRNLLTLFDPLRDVIAMEEPGYDGVRSLFESNRFRLHPLAVHLGPDDFIKSLYASKARLAYITPSNQFPTGKVLPLGTRQRLLKWASEENVYIIEDDYCREFRYNVRPLPSLQSLDRNDRVIYMRTFSKALSPALRMNYLVLPPNLLFEWNKRFEKQYSEVPWLNQAVLARYLADGFWDKHLRRMLAHNKRKYNLLVGALQSAMGQRVDILANGSGLHLLVGVLDGRSQHELLALARRAGVKVYGTDCYWMANHHPMENYVLIGFSAIDENSIEAGVARLAEAWFA
jgi:GntR family transcriptional regulator/MocR family aminotransferase